MEPAVIVDGPQSTGIVLRPGGGSPARLLRALAVCAGQAATAPMLLLPVWLLAGLLTWLLDGSSWIWVGLAVVYGLLAVGMFALLVRDARTIYRLEIVGDSVRVVRLGGGRTVPRGAVRQVLVVDHRVRPYEGDPQPEASTHVHIGIELADGSDGSRSVDGADADALAQRIGQLLPGVPVLRRTAWRTRARQASLPDG